MTEEKVSVGSMERRFARPFARITVLVSIDL